MPPEFSVEELSNFMTHCSLVTSAAATSPKTSSSSENTSYPRNWATSPLWPDSSPPWVFLLLSRIATIVTPLRYPTRKNRLSKKSFNCVGFCHQMNLVGQEIMA